MDVPWTYLGRTLDVPWTYLGRTLDVPWTYLGRTLDVRTISDEIVRYKSSFLRFASPLLPPCYPLAIPLLPPCYRLTSTYPSPYLTIPYILFTYTLRIASLYLAYSLPLSSFFLPSSFLLSTFFLPSSYLLSTHYFVFTKGIFSVVIVRYESSMSQELSIFNSQSPIVNCQLLIVNFLSLFNLQNKESKSSLSITRCEL